MALVVLGIGEVVAPIGDATSPKKKKLPEGRRKLRGCALLASPRPFLEVVPTAFGESAASVRSVGKSCTQRRKSDPVSALDFREKRKHAGLQLT